MALQFLYDGYFAGSVGIGTESPGAKLHVTGNNVNASEATVRIGGVPSFGNGVSRLELVENMSANVMTYGFSLTTDGNSTNNLLIRNHNNSTVGNVAIAVDRITSNVGIGTTSPYNKTHINTTVDGDGLLLDYTANNNKYVGVFFKIDTNTSDAYKKGALVWERTGSYNEGRFHFLLNNDDNASNVDLTDSKVTILSTGNVGIGTTSPGTKLHIKDGSSGFAGTFDARNKSIVEANGEAYFATYVPDNSFSGLRFFNSTALKGFIDYYHGTQGDALVYSATGYHKFITSGTEKVRIINNGNVGIGITSPASKLHVEGVVTIKGSGTGTSGSLAIQDNYTTTDHLGNIGWNRSAGGPYLSYGLKQDGSADWKSTFGNFSGMRTYMKLDNDEMSLAWAPAQTTAVGTVVTGLLERFKFKLDSGSLQLNAYDGTNKTGTPTYLLGTDASGNIVKTNTIPGSAAGPYLPLAGGTMTGDLKLNDNVVAKFGTGDDLRIQHASGGGGAGYIQNYTGDLQIQNRATDKDILFRADDGNGVVTSYLVLDGSTTHAYFSNPGNVGIGTTSPTRKLHVNGDVQVDTNLVVNSGIYNTTYYAGSSTATYFKNSVASDTLTILESGNVGIGTTSPDAKLEISDAANDNLRIGTRGGNINIFSVNDAGATAPLRLEASDFQFINGNATFAGDITTSGEIKIVDSSATGNPKLSFYQTTNERGYIQYADTGEKLIIDSDSSLVLNTNNLPRLTIDSTGLSTFAGNVTVSGTSSTFNTGNSGTFVTNGTSGYPTITLTNSSAQLGLFRAGNGGMYIGADAGGFQIFTTSFSEKFNLDQSGNGTFAGTVSGTTATFTTFSGDLNGTINTVTTGFTQANAVNNTTIATTAYVNNKIALIPAGLIFQGTWNAATNTPTLTSGSGTTGNFYIVSVDGSTNLDGITDWKVGDWAVFVEVGVTDAWQKIDNSSVLDGIGTGQTLPLWSGSGTSNTLTDSLVSQPDTTTVQLNNADLKIVNDLQTGGNGKARIKFSEDATNNSMDIYYDGDGQTGDANYTSIFSHKAGVGDVLVTTYGGSVGIGTTSPVGNLFVGPTWSQTGGNNLYIKSQTTTTSYDPSVNATQDLGITYNTSSTATTGPDKTGLVLHNDAGVAGQFSPMIIFSGKEATPSQYKAAMAGIYARSPLGTGNLNDYIDGELIFATAGAATLGIVQRMVINKEGNVGIGTTSPSEKLEVSGNVLIGIDTISATLGSFAQLEVSDSTKGGIIINTQTAAAGNYSRLMFSVNNNIDGHEGLIRYNSSDYHMAFWTNAGEKMRIDSAGNVGIGTTSPSNLLSVGVANNTISKGITVENTSGTAFGRFGVINPSIDNDTYIGSVSNNNFLLYTNNSERMRITSAGNVGIGTTVPAYKLTVSGGIQAGGKVTYTKSAGSLDTTGYAVAGITALPAGNGFSCGFTFTCFGGVGKYQRLVYGCYNSGGTWNAKKVIDEGTNDLDVVASANGSTITFTFKARSSTQSFTPRVTVEAVGTAINSTYA